MIGVRPTNFLSVSARNDLSRRPGDGVLERGEMLTKE